MSEKSVFVFAAGGANNAIRGLMTEFGNALSSIGLPVVQIALEETAEIQYAIDQIVRGQVRFALTWLGVGQDFSVLVGEERREANAWDTLRVPLLKIHADHPAYFSDRHRDVPQTSVNLYMAAEFAHFRRRWMPDTRTLSAVIPPWPMSPLPHAEIDLAKRRKGTLVFLKNGNSPAQLKALWREHLTPTVASLVTSLADDALAVGLRPGPLHVGDLAAEAMAAHGIDAESALPLVPFLTAQLDDYLRRMKSEMIANALLDFPVIVQGGAWEHVDFTGRRARLAPGEDFIASRRIFTDELGVIDMSPNMDTEPHERVQRAAGSYSLVLTNAQSWIERGFPEHRDLTFEFDPDSIRDRIADVVAHKERYLDLGVSFGERFRELHPMEAFARRVATVAELAVLAYAAEKPAIQPFFLWPKQPF